MDHPDPEVLARYARGELGREESRGLERHLAACVSCQGAVDGLPVRGGVVRWGGHRFAKKEPEPAEETGDAGRRARARGVLRALGGVLTATSESAASRLLAQPEHRRRALIRQEEKFQTLGLCELLLAKCRAAWIDDPAGSVELAKLAALVAQRLNRELYGGPNVDDVRVMAWVHLGISFRLAGGIAKQAASQVAEPEAPPESEDAYPTGVTGAIEIHDGGWPRGPVESALRETRDAFLERRMGFDAALVTLDLISASLKAGQPGEIAPLAREAIGLFEAQNVEPYALDSMRFLLSSAEADDGVNQELVNRMAVLLHRKRNGMEEGL